MTTRARTIWPLALGGGITTLAALVVAAMMALFGASVSCLGDAAQAGPAGPAPKGTGRIPAARLHIYEAAGNRFDVSWPFLASVNYQECGFGLCPNVNPSGCAGPMEIAYVRGSACSPDPSAPTLWERFGVDADGDGRSIFDPADAIFTAARIFHEDIGAPPAGGSYHGYFEAACSYYGACADASADYAHEVMARAVEFGFGHEGRVAGGGEGRRSVGSKGPACSGSPVSSTGASGPAIVKVARSQLGTTESPLGSNCTRYGPCEEWCALFVAWVWQHAGVPMQGGTSPYAYSGSFYGWVKEHGGRVLPPGATPSPGDAVLYGWGPTASEHVGIVESVLGGEIVTIEGNYGDRVARVGPFPPALAVAEGEPGPIYAYAEPPGVGGTEGARP